MRILNVHWKERNEFLKKRIKQRGNGREWSANGADDGAVSQIWFMHFHKHIKLAKKLVAAVEEITL